MPRINPAGVTQRAETLSATSGMLTPALVNADAGQIRASLLNPNSALVQFAPIEPTKITVDSRWDAAANMTKQIIQAAEQYSDRMATTEALGVQLETEQQLTSLVNNYKSLQSEKASKSYQPLVQQLDEVYQNTIEGTEETVRAKLIIPLQKKLFQLKQEAATYKVKQDQVWQGEVIQAKELQERQNLTAKIDDPQAFMQSVGAHIKSLETTQPNLSKEQVFIQQSKFYNSIMEDAVSTMIKRGSAEAEAGNSGAAYFEKALQYLNIGATEDYKIDGLVLAKKQTELISAMNNARKVREDAADSQEKALERAGKQQMRSALRMAIDNHDPRYIMAIQDPMLQGQARNAYNGMMHGFDAPDAVVTKLYQNLGTLASDPHMVFDENFAPGVPFKTREALYEKAVSINNDNSKQLLKDADAFAKSLVVPDFMGQFTKVEDKQTYAALMDRFTSAITSASTQGKDPAVALAEAKTAVLNDQNFNKNFAQVKLTRARLVDIDGVPNSGMMQLDKLPEVTVESVQQAFDQSKLAIRKKYGLFGKSKEQAQVLLQMNPQLETEISNDMLKLSLQRRYYLQRTNTDSNISQFKRN